MKKTRFSYNEDNLSIKYITGTTYDGAYDDERKCMHGFGYYAFPNGGSYRGYFKNGMFHGYGHIILITPVKFTVKGFFEKGHLCQLINVTFGDKLRVNLQPKGNDLDFSEWAYCTPEDRRFLKEISDSFKATEQLASISRRSVAVELPPDNYDTEEGIYDANSGFITDRQAYSAKSAFVASAKEVEWIKEHCRGGRQVDEVIEPKQQYCRKIIDSNIQSQKWVNDVYSVPCSSVHRPADKYFTKLCKLEIERAQKTMTVKETVEVKSKDVTPLDVGSDVSISSFQNEKQKEAEVFERVCEQPRRICDDEGSLSVDMSLLEWMKSVYGSQ